MSIKIKELPDCERPYEKMELYGGQALSNAELLAIIIKSGTRKETSVEVAQKLLNLNYTKDGDLNFLREMSIEELTKIKGIGKVKAIQLKAIAELAIRMATPTNYKKIVVTKPNDVAKIFMEELRYKKREICKIVILNQKNQILKIKDISIGSSGLINLSIKDIMSDPTKMQAPKIILVHNHPSGDSKPSVADINFTKRLVEISEIMGIHLLDHIVIGNNNYTSIFSEIFKEQKTKI